MVICKLSQNEVHKYSEQKQAYKYTQHACVGLDKSTKQPHAVNSENFRMLPSRPDDEIFLHAGLGQELEQFGWTMSLVLVQN